MTLHLRQILTTFALSALVACQTLQVDSHHEQIQNWSILKSKSKVTLASSTGSDDIPFALTCTRKNRTLTVSAGVAQVGFANMAPPFAIIASGANFDAKLVPGMDGTKNFAVKRKLTPKLLAALRDTATTRVFVNDGYAYAESEVDQGQEFEIFVAQCSALTGIKPSR